MPSSFADLDYWECRFTRDRNSFDWLLPAFKVVDIVAQAIKDSAQPSPRLLHIGCGTSDLSYRLQRLVRNGDQVLNVDFSRAAIAACISADAQVGHVPENLRATRRMLWRQADLLSLADLKTLSQSLCSGCNLSDVVIDKSTSDAISCGEDVPVDLPYRMMLYELVDHHFTCESQPLARVHPLHILAVHLALLTTPGVGRWVVISYSDHRFPFLPPYPSSPTDGLLGQDTVEAGFPDPARLWRLEKKWQIKATEESAQQVQDTSTVYRPEVFHWVYVLVRTDVQLAFGI